MQRIKIERQGTKVVFNPAVQNVDTVTDGGSFIFENDDPQQAHQPVPDKGGSWCDDPIQPDSPSPLITAPSTGVFPYHCKLHTTEKGIVQAPAVITIQTELIQAGFNPSSETTTPSKDGGLIMFLNLDQTKSHQPVPDNPANGTWFDQPIAPQQYSPAKAITQPGTYAYHCKIHPSETGTLTVNP